MSNDYFNPPNSIWPNGLKRDVEGYVTFYPLGTNKVNSSEITMPEGDVLKAPYVYKAGNLVGFVDDKALNGETFNIPYKQVSMEIGGQPLEINLNDECDTFVVTLTKATTGPIINKSGINEVETTYDINAPEMTSAVGMFSNRKIKSIKLYIPKLADGTDMFKGCELTSEQIYSILNSIPTGNGESNIDLGKLPSDITEEYLVTAFADKGWKVTKIEEEDTDGNTKIRYIDLTEDEKTMIKDSVKIVDDICYDDSDNEIGRFDFDRLIDCSVFDENTFNFTDDLLGSVIRLFHSNMKSLVDGRGLFAELGSLESIKSNFKSLREQSISGPVSTGSIEVGMCAMSDILDFDGDMPLLENGNGMFILSPVRHFRSDLKSLKKGKYMFGIPIKEYLTLLSGLPEAQINSYIQMIKSGILTEDTTQIAFIIVQMYLLRASLDGQSIKNISESIKDISNDNINYNRETGEGYIDIFAGFTENQYPEDLGTLEEVVDIFERKGWKYSIRFLDHEKYVKKFEELTDAGLNSDKEVINAFMQLISLSIGSETLISNWEEEEEEDVVVGEGHYSYFKDSELLKTCSSVENNICYDADGNVMGEFDTSKITHLSDLWIYTEPQLNVAVIPEHLVNDNSNVDYLFGHLGAYSISENDYPIINLAGAGSESAALTILNSYTSLNLVMNETEITNITFPFMSVERFSSPLTNLKNWNQNIFPHNVKEFISDLPNLTEWIFPYAGLTMGSLQDYQAPLEIFKADMPKLIKQPCYFLFIGGALAHLKKLHTFEGSLKSLKNGMFMFADCINLSSFKSDLSSLICAENMFGELIGSNPTILNVESIDNIADTINDLSDYPEEEREIEILDRPGYSPTVYKIGTIDIGLGFNPSDYNGKYGTWENLKAAFSAKKWKANFYFSNGSSESTTYGLRNSAIPNPTYAKLEEVFPKPAMSRKEKLKRLFNNTKMFKKVKDNLLEHYESLPDYESTKTAMPYYNYTSQDGTRYYKLTTFNDSNIDYEGYDQFGSLEEAVAYYDIKPVIDKDNLVNYQKLTSTALI